MPVPFLLKLNLQRFADNPPQDPPTDPPTEVVDDPGENPTGGAPDKGAEPKTFTQDQLDAIIADRLARERKKQEDAERKIREEAERKKLEENEEYKTLATKLQEQLDAIKGDALGAKKEALLAKAGYTQDQIEKYVKYVDGETDEQLSEAVEALKADIPPKPKFADPSPGNGGKQEPKKTDLHDTGVSMYQRLKAKGKIRRG
jgi:hypothetical protein